MARKVELKEGDVFYPRHQFGRHTHRRIVGFLADRVVFSSGGNKNHTVKRTSFIKWRKREAEGDSSGT